MIRNPLDINTYSIELEEISDPAAGAELLHTPPAGRILSLAQLDFQFAADANVANRLIYIDYRWALRNYRLGAITVNIVASETWHVICHKDVPFNTANNVQDYYIPLPDIQLFNDNAELVIRVTNIQATDQISDIHAIWKYWMLKPS